MNRDDFYAQAERLVLAFGSDIKQTRIDFYFKIFENYPQPVFKVMVDGVLGQERTFPSIAALRKYEDEGFRVYRQFKESERKIPGTVCGNCLGSGWVDFGEDFKPTHYPNGYSKPCYCTNGDPQRATLSKQGYMVTWTDEEKAYMRLRQSERMVEDSGEMIRLRDKHPQGSKMWRIMDTCLKNYQNARDRESGKTVERSRDEDAQEFVEEMKKVFLT